MKTPSGRNSRALRAGTVALPVSGAADGVTVGLRPEHLAFAADGLPGRVVQIEPMGRETLYVVATDFGHLRVLGHGAGEGGAERVAQVGRLFAHVAGEDHRRRPQQRDLRAELPGPARVEERRAHHAEQAGNAPVRVGDRRARSELHSLQTREPVVGGVAAEHACLPGDAQRLVDLQVHPAEEQRTDELRRRFVLPHERRCGHLAGGGIEALEHVLDGALLDEGEGAAHRARVDQCVVVDEERGRSLPGSFAPEGPEHPNVHSRGILA